MSALFAQKTFLDEIRVSNNKLMDLSNQQDCDFKKISKQDNIGIKRRVEMVSGTEKAKDC